MKNYSIFVHYLSICVVLCTICSGCTTPYSDTWTDGADVLVTADSTRWHEIAASPTTPRPVAQMLSRAVERLYQFGLGHFADHALSSSTGRSLAFTVFEGSSDKRYNITVRAVCIVYYDDSGQLNDYVCVPPSDFASITAVTDNEVEVERTPFKIASPAIINFREQGGRRGIDANPVLVDGRLVNLDVDVAEAEPVQSKYDSLDKNSFMLRERLRGNQNTYHLSISNTEIQLVLNGTFVVCSVPTQKTFKVAAVLVRNGSVTAIQDLSSSHVVNRMYCTFSRKHASAAWSGTLFSAQTTEPVLSPTKRFASGLMGDNPYTRNLYFTVGRVQNYLSTNRGVEDVRFKLPPIWLHGGEH